MAEVIVLVPATVAKEMYGPRLMSPPGVQDPGKNKRPRETDAYD